MPVWLEVFIAAACAAIVVQTFMVISTLMAFRPLITRFGEIASNLQAKLNPILATTTRILADSEDRVKSIMGDAAEITHLARGEAQKADRVLTDAIERLRLQIIRADHIITGALEVVEDTGVKVRKTVLTPVNQFSAILKGLKVGLDVIRGNATRRSGDGNGVPQDEELFI